MDPGKEKIVGLTTEEAFDRLFQELTSKLANYKSSVGRYIYKCIHTDKCLWTHKLRIFEQDC